MAWCKRCNEEYEPHIKNCIECGDELIEHLEADLEVEESKDYGPFILLANVANTIEADILISRLRADEIPARKGYQSSGEYLNIATGFNYQGVDVYVPKELFEAAKLNLIIDEEAGMASNGCEDHEFTVLVEGFTRRRKNLVLLIAVAVVVVPLILLLILKLG